MKLTNSPYQDKVEIGSSHFLVKTALSLLPQDAKVLDVGIGAGVASRLSAEKGLKFFGIEPNSEWANTVKHYYSDIFIGGLEETPDIFLSGFNAILLSDVLEHMADPWNSLKRLVDLQDRDTLFLISIPNIANVWIRLNLFLGRFEYAQSGILDQTHLRFFTKKSFQSMLDSVGLEVSDLMPTPIPLGSIHPLFQKDNLGYPIYLFLLWITKVFPTFFGYQFFCRATKRGN